MFHRVSFRLTTVLTLGIASGLFFLFQVTTALAAPISVKSSMLADYSPPSNQGTPPKDEITRSTSGRSDTIESQNTTPSSPGNDSLTEIERDHQLDSIQAPVTSERSEPLTVSTPTNSKTR